MGPIGDCVPPTAGELRLKYVQHAGEWYGPTRALGSNSRSGEAAVAAAKGRFQ
jgi:hypothetical protein